MARQIKRLNARKAETVSEAGRHADGGGLYLDVATTGARKWVFIYRSPCHRVAKGGSLVGKLREMGLGSAETVSLADARKKATAARGLIDAKIDPLDAKEAEAARNRQPTFGEMADEVIAALESGWRNDKHRAQWRATLETYCAPLRGKLVNDIGTDDVLAVLQPIWTKKAETASRVRGRIEKVLDAAKAKSYRTGENPARWRGHLDHLLPPRQKLQRGHHPAMPWQDVPAFVARLREQQSVGARCLEFVILTAARSGEVLRSVRDGEIEGARWDEIDREAKVWTVPAARMKAGKVHRKPLTARMLAILDEMEQIRRGPFIFPADKKDGPLSEMALEMLLRRCNVKPATVHGFRASFKSWAGDVTQFPREIVEEALAHEIGNAVERAYKRGDALERRRELAEAWERFIEQVVRANVIEICPALGTIRA